MYEYWNKRLLLNSNQNDTQDSTLDSKKLEYIPVKTRNIQVILFQVELCIGLVYMLKLVLSGTLQTLAFCIIKEGESLTAETSSI